MPLPRSGVVWYLGQLEGLRRKRVVPVQRAIAQSSGTAWLLTNATRVFEADRRDAVISKVVRATLPRAQGGPSFDKHTYLLREIVSETESSHLLAHLAKDVAV